MIHVFETPPDNQPQTTLWAGFTKAGGTRMTLGEYLEWFEGGWEEGDEEDSGHDHYGFDFRPACDCGGLMQSFEVLPFFMRDAFPLDPTLPRANWPSLVIGPGGSRSNLHVDSKLLPFWLTLLSGRKTFRVVGLDDWREHLTKGDGPYNDDGTMRRAINGFDDEMVESEMIARGATVYNSSIIPGDTVYIPTGALHGALNDPSAGPAIAVTSNFIDAAHAPQVLEKYCLRGGAGDVQRDPVCFRLLVDPFLSSFVGSSVLRSEEPHNKFSEWATARSHTFWDWHLRFPGFCAKFLDQCPHVTTRCREAGEISMPTAGGRGGGFLLGAAPSKDTGIPDLDKDGETSRIELLVALVSAAPTMRRDKKAGKGGKGGAGGAGSAGVVQRKGGAASGMEAGRQARRWAEEKAEEIWPLEEHKAGWAPAANVLVQRLQKMMEVYGQA